MGAYKPFVLPWFFLVNKKTLVEVLRFAVVSSTTVCAGLQYLRKITYISKERVWTQ